MRRHLRLLKVFIVNSIQREAEYRSNFMVSFVDTALALATGLIVMQSLFAQAAGLGGWTFTETLAVFGIFIVMEQAVEFILTPNLGRLSEYIQQGQLDYMLLKPVELQFHLSLRHVNIWRLPGIALGAAIVVYSMAGTGHLTAANLVLAAVLGAAGLLILYSIWLFFKTTAFWFVRVDSLTVVFLTLLGVGRFPVSALPDWLRLVFTVVVPIAFITTVPASAAVGRLDWTMAGLALLAASMLFAASRSFLKFAISRYSSASS